MPDNKTWLAQVAEDVLEPELPIVDPHHHLWDLPGSRYLLDELLADTGAADALGRRHGVRATVYVECASMYRADGPEALRPVGETDFVAGLAAMSPPGRPKGEYRRAKSEGTPVSAPARAQAAAAPAQDFGGPAEADRPEGASGAHRRTRVAAGVVGFADLRLGAAVREVLQAHVEAAHGRFRGIRHAAGWHADARIRHSHTKPPPGLLLDPVFREGFAQLAPMGLSFDAWLYHPQIAELTDLARAFPGTTIVLDHYGGPLGIGPYEGRADEVYADWRRSIDALARCPNVFAKLGGLHMPINGFGWHKAPRPPGSAEVAAATQRYVRHTIERFGPQRCMFESNFPVDKASCSYIVLWNAFKRLAAGFSVDEKAALFHGTATRVYRL